MGDGEALHKVNGQLLCHVCENALLLVEGFLIGADEASFVIQLQPLQVLVFVSRERCEYDLVAKILGGRAVVLLSHSRIRERVGPAIATLQRELLG